MGIIVWVKNRKQLCPVNFEQFDDVAKLARQVNYSLQQETQKFDLWRTNFTFLLQMHMCWPSELFTGLLLNMFLLEFIDGLTVCIHVKTTRLRKISHIYFIFFNNLVTISKQWIGVVKIKNSLRKMPGLAFLCLFQSKTRWFERHNMCLMTPSFQVKLS